VPWWAAAAACRLAHPIYQEPFAAPNDTQTRDDTANAASGRPSIMRVAHFRVRRPGDNRSDLVRSVITRARPNIVQRQCSRSGRLSVCFFSHDKSKVLKLSS